MLTIKEAWTRFKRDININITVVGFLLITIVVGVLTIISQSLILTICYTFIVLLAFLSLQIYASHSEIMNKLEDAKK